jgi:D-amino peptidase
MSKYMIRCDIEGVTGVVSYEQAEPGRPEYEFGKAMFMSDLSAMINGLNDGGADSIVVYDEHYFGRNIDLSEIPENVTVICGKPPYTAEWAGGLDESFTGLLLLGFHSKRGTGELLHHSYEPDIKDLLLNGVSVGEIGMEAAIAGDFGVPLQMITADSAGVAEAKELVPGTVGVSVKESMSADGGACLPAKLTARRIRDAAAGLLKNIPAAKAWKVENPDLTVVFNPGRFHDKFSELFNCGESITINGTTVTACWADYWRKKNKTLEALNK